MSGIIDTMLQAQQVQKKRTWRLTLNRKDNNIRIFANLHIIKANNEKIILEFQTEANTQPTINLVEVS